MGRAKKYIEYIKEIKVISEWIRDTPKSEKSQKTHFLALDKFMPTMINRFKVELTLEGFDLKSFEGLTELKQEDIKKEWAEAGLNDKVFDLWKEISAERKADILVKWRLREGEERVNVNTNYIWRIQGLLSKLGRDYEANPKNMPQIGTNGFHLTEKFNYEEVVALYEKLPQKLKMILKVMMYTGYNGVDIVKLKPKDFLSYTDEETNITVHYVMKKRQKTERKEVHFVNTFSESFISELKDYFETTIIKNIKKSATKKIKECEENCHFKKTQDTENYVVYEGKYDWIKDGSRPLFPMTSSLISEGIKYHINKNNLNKEINPAGIRRMCFTRLKKVFSLEDDDIYNIWTQHKADIITQHYMVDLLKRTVGYIEKAEEYVLLGGTVAMVRKIRTLSNGIKAVKEIQKENVDLRSEIKDMKVEFLSELADIRKEMEMIKGGVPAGIEKEERDAVMDKNEGKDK